MTMWTVFLALCIGVGVVAALAPLFRARRAWDTGESSDLDRLFDDKARVLRTVKDLDHEREAGLLTEQDWRDARAAAVDEAVRLNREISEQTGIDAAAAEAQADAPDAAPPAASKSAAREAAR